MPGRSFYMKQYNEHRIFSPALFWMRTWEWVCVEELFLLLPSMMRATSKSVDLRDLCEYSRLISWYQALKFTAFCYLYRFVCFRAYVKFLFFFILFPKFFESLQVPDRNDELVCSRINLNQFYNSFFSTFSTSSAPPPEIHVTHQHHEHHAHAQSSGWEF